MSLKIMTAKPSRPYFSGNSAANWFREYSFGAPYIFMAESLNGGAVSFDFKINTSTKMEDKIMDVMKLATGLLAKQLGGNNDAIGGVMNSLIGGGDKMDIGSLVSGLQSKGLGDVASSWLGDGENAAISADQLKGVLGESEVAQAAAQLGTDEGSLLDSLSSALPQMVDQSSKGGSLLDSVGGIGGIAGMAKKFL